MNGKKQILPSRLAPMHSRTPIGQEGPDPARGPIGTGAVICQGATVETLLFPTCTPGPRVGTAGCITDGSVADLETRLDKPGDERKRQ
jgi:hypothetical protein